MLGGAELLLIGIVLFVPFGSAFVAYHVAERKGRDPWTWAILTALTLVALVALLLLPTPPRRPLPVEA